MGLRYIGSKARVADDIVELLGAPTDRHRRLVDGFCGTGSVAVAAARAGWDVLVNDALFSSAVMAAARLVSAEDAPFTYFGGYQAACDFLNNIPSVPGFITREYSPLSVSHSGQERRYFTAVNAARIDTIRTTIATWHREGLLGQAEHQLLLADLMFAANEVANIAGTYGCFLRDWSPGAAQTIQVRPRQLACRTTKAEVTVGDAIQLEYGAQDVAYFDPPYTKRQYAAYYHIPETIALGDAPEVGGVTGLRPWKHLASDYCYRTRARSALRELIETCPADRILLSYSNEGHVTRDDVEAVLEGHGDVVVHTVGSIGRYRPNKGAATRGSHVEEYVFEVLRADAPTEAVA